MSQSCRAEISRIIAPENLIGREAKTHENPYFTVFISSAHVNNTTGWVSKFAKQLERVLPGEMPFNAKIKVSRNESHLNEIGPLPDDIRKTASSSDIYLAIFSRGYCNSARCTKEREAFFARWREDAKNRLLVIRHSPVDMGTPGYPEEFKDILGFPFYAIEDENNPHADNFTFGEDQVRNKTFQIQVRRVAKAISRQLNEISKVQILPVQVDPVQNFPEIKSPAPCINLLVVAPKDMREEAKALYNVFRNSGCLSIDTFDIAIVPAEADDILDVHMHYRSTRRSEYDVMVLIVWWELGDALDREVRHQASLAERAYRAAKEAGATVFLYRCNREALFSPEDDLERKAFSLKKAKQFFALFEDPAFEDVYLRKFRATEELQMQFEIDLKDLVRQKVKRTRQLVESENATLPPPHDIKFDDLKNSYLNWTIEKHERLELRGIGGTASLATISLEEVYVALRGVRASNNERQQSRKLFQSELFSLVRARSKAISAEEFAHLIEEAELDALIDNPLMPLLTHRDRPIADVKQLPEVVISLGEAFRTERWLVVLGDPGSGKTTLLRWIVRKLTRALLASSDPQQRVEVLAHQVDPSANRADSRMIDLGPARLPVLVRIAEYSDALFNARRRGETLSLIDFLGSTKHTWQGQRFNGSGPRLNQLIKSYIEQGRAVVLLDGMDEVTASSQRDEVVHAIEAFIAGMANPRGAPFEIGGNQVLITSRIAGYHASPITGLVSHMTVQPMQRRAVEHFCDAWALAVNLQATPDDKVHAAKIAEIEATGLKAEIFNPQSPQLWELASNPLMITILALIYKQTKGHLPRQRSELYHAALKILIENWRFAGITTDEMIYVLSPLAAKIHSEHSTGLIKEDAMLEVITSGFARFHDKSTDNPLPTFLQEVRSFLRRVREDVGLISERSPKLYGFLHLTFQEYLAGLYLVRDRNTAAQVIVDHIDDPRWREPILLALGHISTNPDWGPSARTKLLRQILDADDPLGELIPRGPLLVIQALPEMDNIDDNVVGELLERLLHAYTACAAQEASIALTRQIERALNSVYDSAHQTQVVEEFARMMDAVAVDRSRALACCSLIRANGWRHPHFAGPLFRCQICDEVRWSLPVTSLLRNWVAPKLREVDLTREESKIRELSDRLNAVRSGELERSLRAEIEKHQQFLAEQEERK